MTAFILAGGRSTRMGRDKAALRFRGTTLLERARQLAGTAASVVHVCGPRERFGPEAVEDRYPGQGPLAGIHAALGMTATDFNLVLSVDTPFIAPEFLAYLAAEAQRSGAVVTVPESEGRIQPLCAMYRREFAAVAEMALQAGRNQIEPLFQQVSLRRIADAEIRKLAFDPRMFDNLNTPEDFERAQRRA